MKCSKCSCESNCDLLKKEIKLLDSFLEIEKRRVDELLKLMNEVSEEEIETYDL